MSNRGSGRAAVPKWNGGRRGPAPPRSSSYEHKPEDPAYPPDEEDPFSELPVEEEELAPEDDGEILPEEVQDWELELDADRADEELNGSDDEKAPDPLEEEAEPEEDQAEEEDANGLPKREGDLALDEIPDDMREAVEGNLELKRALSNGSMGDRAAKRRKGNPVGEPPPLESEVAISLVRRWRIEKDYCAKFVLRLADPRDVEELHKSRWAPRSVSKRTDADQIYEALTKIRQKRGPPGGPLDLISAFGHTWRISQEDDEALAKLDHKSLRHVFREFCGEKPMPECIKEAQEERPSDKDLPVPDKKGLFVLGRGNCLELLDPYTDALVVGDANLTFSMELAEHRKSLGHSGKILSSTFEKVETLRKRYPEIDKTIKDLEGMGCDVMHNVDCTRLAVDPRFVGMDGKFGAVYYNFPHAGVVQGFFDGHPFVRWRHANLMILFFRALRSFVTPGGMVKVSSNSRATGVLFSDIIGGAIASEFVHVETLPFLEWRLSHYRRSYGDRRDSVKRPEDGQVYDAQKAYSDMVYCFVYKPSGRKLQPASIHYPPTKDELYLAGPKEGRMPSGPTARQKKVDELYDLFMTYIQGIHVG